MTTVDHKYLIGFGKYISFSHTLREEDTDIYNKVIRIRKFTHLTVANRNIGNIVFTLAY